MPSGFIEVSGYSLEDLQEAYNDGYEAGSEGSLQGTATQAQVLSGYTFSSEVAGVNKSGTMPNKGNVSRQLTPGDSYSSSGYFTSLEISAEANEDTYTFPNNDTGATKDLGSDNLYRYVNAQPVYAKGMVDGITQGRQQWFNYVSCTYLVNERHTSSVSSILPKRFTPTKDGLITIEITLWRATTSSPRTYPELSNFQISGATLLDFTNNPLIINDFRDDTTGNTASATGARLTAIAKCTANTQVDMQVNVLNGGQGSIIVRQIAM